MMLLLMARAAQDAAIHVTNAENTDLLRLILGAVAAGIVGIGGYIAYVTRAVLPPAMDRSERQTKALEQMAAAQQALPMALEKHETSIVLKVSEVVRTETQGAARDLGGQIDNVEASLARRLSATERAVQDQRAELIRMGAPEERLSQPGVIEDDDAAIPPASVGGVTPAPRGPLPSVPGRGGSRH